jgi:hypothetical protein
MSTAPGPRPWRSALPDLVAFLVGLAVAWARGWHTTDLIWSLWLSSLVIGYALIVWAVLQPALELLGLGWQHRAEVEASLTPKSGKQIAILLAIALVGALFYLAFFTTHFGFFHYIHSQLLLGMYPLGDGFTTMNRATFAEVLRRYSWALPSAFLARRYAFARRTFVPRSSSDAGTGGTPLGRDGRPTRRPETAAESRVFGPYLQVMRMHAVIIAFGAVHAARRESFLVYALIYALNFFPWRLVRDRLDSRTATARESGHLPAVAPTISAESGKPVHSAQGKA